MRSRLVRSLGIAALLPVFGLTFWMAATVASSLPGLIAFAVDVHGLGLVSYAADSGQRPAPLSLQVLDDAAGDANGAPALPAASPAPTLRPLATPTPSARPVPTPTPTPTPRPTPTPTPKPSPTPTPTPLPVPTPTPSLLPLPTPTPVPTPTPGPIPVPTPTPSPSLLPLPLPLPVPILPSLLPRILK